MAARQAIVELNTPHRPPRTVTVAQWQSKTQTTKLSRVYHELPAGVRSRTAVRAGQHHQPPPSDLSMPLRKSCLGTHSTVLSRTAARAVQHHQPPLSDLSMPFRKSCIGTHSTFRTLSRTTTAAWVLRAEPGLSFNIAMAVFTLAAISTSEPVSGA